jgi:hypothetical protein
VWPIHRSKILCWAQKSILYGVWNATGSHESPKTWNSNKSCRKILYLVYKKFIFSSFNMDLEIFFTIIHKTVISFMNRKFSCGYATHLFFLLTNLIKVNTYFMKKTISIFLTNEKDFGDKLILTKTNQSSKHLLKIIPGFGLSSPTRNFWEFTEVFL